MVTTYFQILGPFLSMSVSVFLSIYSPDGALVCEG